MFFSVGVIMGSVSVLGNNCNSIDSRDVLDIPVFYFSGDCFVLYSFNEVRSLVFDSILLASSIVYDIDGGVYLAKDVALGRCPRWAMTDDPLVPSISSSGISSLSVFPCDLEGFPCMD